MPVLEYATGELPVLEYARETEVPAGVYPSAFELSPVPQPETEEPGEFTKGFQREIAIADGCHHHV